MNLLNRFVNPENPTIDEIVDVWTEALESGEYKREACEVV